MHEQEIKKNSGKKLTFADALFICFCLMPFLIPNPVVVTNIQPYAALVGTLIIVRERKLVVRAYSFEIVATATFVIALMILLFSGINIAGFRAIYNYYAVFIVPWAAMITVRRLNDFPEKLIKTLILIWFGVATVQFFIYRGFLTQLIGGVRWSESYRGVVGLASEPSFLGISCFYFLHMVQQFKTRKVLYTVITLLTGVIYAQSAMGIIFIGAYLAVLLLDEARGWKGILLWIAAILAAVVFLHMLETVLVGSRLHSLYVSFLEGGAESVTEDVSVETRVSSISQALKNAFDNYLLPLGYGERIGSGYGGFLCELGFFSIPVMAYISYSMSLTFKRSVSRFLYFVVVTVLLFNNTQIGNPLLLFVVGSNLALRELQMHSSAQLQPLASEPRSEGA